MSNEHIVGKPIAKIVIMVVILCLSSWSLHSYFELKRLEQEMAAKETRSAMIQLQHSLQIPTEVLYHDYKLSREFVSLRMKGYQNYGVQTLLPYMNLVNDTNGTTGDQGRREFPVEKPENFGAQLSDFSQEYYWLNHIPRECQTLASQMNHGNGIGGYLKQHPAEFDKHIRPMIVRLLDSTHPWISGHACEVLLAAGDRSDELMEILSILMRVDNYSGVASRLVADYHLNVTPDTIISNDEYLKDSRNPEWKRIHALTIKLKEKHPMVVGTIIGNM